MRCRFAITIALLGGINFSAAPAQSGEPKSAELKSAEPDRAGIDFFEEKIRPTLVKHCYECHSAKSKIVGGKLLLDTREGIRRGGETGPGIVPGKPEKSLLISALKQQDFEMPPAGRLPKPVIADFVAWVKRGAPDPRKGPSKPLPLAADKIDFAKARKFWSFRPVRHPPLPDVAGANGLSPIDRFIRAKLAAKKLQLSPQVDKQTLVRRLFFDLIGLPPTPEQIDQFVSDKSPEAYAKLVDRLLASRHFGERWGRHWMDVVRFAESSGGGRTQVYHDAWRYRDYVIDAFNSDKPFDQFTREQISGDLMPWKTSKQRRDQITATGFLMLGPTNYELQDKELLRMEVIDEQIDTMGRAFLGMTLGCVRCHAHKFDPIPHEDYYALAGIFRSTHILTPGNVAGFVTRALPVNEQQARAIAEYERKSSPVKNEIADLTESLRLLRRQQSGVTGNKVTAATLPGIVLDDTHAKFSGQWGVGAGNPSFVGTGYRYSSSRGATVRYVFNVKQPGRYEIRVAYNAHPNRASSALVTVTAGKTKKEQRVNQKMSPPIAGLFISIGMFDLKPGQPLIVELSTHGARGNVVADAVQLLPQNLASRVAKATPKRAKADTRLATQISVESKRLKQLQAQFKKLKKSAPPAGPKAMACEDQKQPGDYFVCIRGSAHNLGKKVPRGFLTVISGDKPPRIPSGESGRRELATWLSSGKNPLISRVYVNRVWHHLFGSGIVRTTDNFGAMGELPSHAKLLDWLAATFIAPVPQVGAVDGGWGWSTKKLVRKIVLSETYRQSAAFNPALQKADPENRLFGRQNRRRLEAESIRDALLTVSGQLDLTAAGPSIPPKTKSEFNFKHDSLRRSVYVPVLRNTLAEILSVFDFADPNLVVGRRNISTLPTQALFMMNSPFVMRQANLAADRLLASTDTSHEKRLNLAYRRTLGRSPTPAERRISLAHLRKAEGKTTDDRRQAWATVFQALFACIDFRYIE